MINFPIRKFIGALILTGTIIVTVGASSLHLFEKPVVFSVAFFRGEQLQDGSDVVIQQAVNFLVDKPFKARIVGFSKQGGDVDADMALSLTRANDVASMLESKGIDANRLIIIGKGGSADNTARVDIVVQK